MLTYCFILFVKPLIWLAICRQNFVPIFTCRMVTVACRGLRVLGAVWCRLAWWGLAYAAMGTAVVEPAVGPPCVDKVVCPTKHDMDGGRWAEIKQRVGTFNDSARSPCWISHEGR